jgi:hypothetical protein
MKYKDWSDWRVTCSGISEIMVRPQGAKPPTKSELKKIDAILNKEETTEADVLFLLQMEEKEARYKNPELSATAIKHLIRRYSWEKYNKRVVSIDYARSTARKGNIMEDEAIEIVSNLDKEKYVKEQGVIGNDYLNGVCDVFHTATRKIIDVKASWNIYTFMPNIITPITDNYWYQMQGYMEIYDADVAEVCHVLVNTPPHLIMRERERLADKYMTGEITKDKYDSGMEGLDHSFDYNKIPVKRRVIRQEILRHRDVIPLIYSNVNKCRLWLNEFEKIHILNKKIIIPPDKYVKSQKDEDNPEPDTADPR